MSWDDVNKSQLTQIGSQRETKVPISPKLKLRELIRCTSVTYRNIREGLLREADMTQANGVAKVHLGMADSSEKLETLSTLHNIEADGQVGRYLFQAAQIV